MTAVTRKNKVKRTLSTFCSSSNFLSLLESLMLLAPLLFKTLKERFYEAGILISEPEPARFSELHEKSRRARSLVG
jgi:hypothetical protein